MLPTPAVFLFLCPLISAKIKKLPSGGTVTGQTNQKNGDFMEGTLIGDTMKIKGEITSRESLQLNGELEGQVQLDSRLTIGPKGKASANIKAKEVDIAGSVQGNIDASERIMLRKGANLVGDVRTAGIVIEDGAYFKGGVDIAKPGN
jgi:cytoskeletal protein CcmA (bactofilin family)